MFIHQLKMALRTIFKNRLYSLISIFGLAVGLTVTILITSFVRYEAGFDGMHHGSERIHRLNWDISGSRFATFFNGVTPIYAEIFPQIESFTRLAPSNQLLNIDGINQYGVVTAVDNDFFNIFNYAPISGDANGAVRDMSSAVVTEAAALEYFGATSPASAIGEVFSINGEHDFRIAAVVENNPGNSHLGANVFINIENLPVIWNNSSLFENLGSDVFYHYVRLAPGTDPVQFQEELRAAYTEEINPGFPVQVYLQPLAEIHFTTDLQNEISMRDDVLGFVKPIRQRSDILVFGAVAMLTLVIVAINFMNLQLVQFTKRAREVGIRRIVGSTRAELVRQFLIETVLISGVAMFLALILCEAFMPYFNTMVAASIDSRIVFDFENVLILVLLAIGMGVLGGLYPAITIARLSPVNAIKGEVIKGVSSERFRSGLIVAQFAISIGLIISAGIVNNQIEYALSSGLGFEPVNVVTVELPTNESRQSYDTMRSELSSIPGVLSVSVANIIPGRDLSDGTGYGEVNGVEQNFGVRSVTVGDEYFTTLGMELVAGRFLDEDFPTDWMGNFSLENVSRTGSIVINETAARQLATNPEDAVGAQLFGSGEFNGITFSTTANVVGVVRDAQFASIRAEVPAIGFTMEESRRVMIIKIAADNQPATLAAIDRVWEQNVIELPVQRNFLSDSYQVFYAGEQRTFSLFLVLSVIAIGIACLGLYAVTSFIAERRTKEISIRKILGASVRDLANMLAWDFSKLVLVANIVAWPVAWWGMQRWLANFTFQTEIGVGMFLLAGVATFLLALVTTFQRAFHVANKNPVVSLRAE